MTWLVADWNGWTKSPMSRWKAADPADSSGKKWRGDAVFVTVCQIAPPPEPMSPRSRLLARPRVLSCAPVPAIESVRFASQMLIRGGFQRRASNRLMALGISGGIGMTRNWLTRRTGETKERG